MSSPFLRDAPGAGFNPYNGNVAVLRWRRKRLLVPAAILGVIGAFALAYHFSVYRLQREIDSEWAKLDQLGAIVSEEEYIAAAQLDGVDAGRGLLLAQQAFDKIPEEIEYSVRANPTKAEELLYIEHFSSVLPHLIAASKAEVIRPDLRRWEDQPSRSLGSLGSVESNAQRFMLTRLLRYSTLQAKHSEFQRASEHFDLYMDIQNLPGGSPNLIGLYRAHGSHNQKLRSFIFIGESAKELPALDSFEEQMRKLPVAIDYRYYLSGEPICALQDAMRRGSHQRLSFKELIAKKKLPTPREFSFSTERGRKQVELHILRYWRIVFENLPPDPFIFDGHLEAFKKGREYISGLSEPMNEIVSESSAYEDMLVQSEFDLRAHRKTVPTALQLLKIRLTAGEFPKTLPDLGEMSKDPANGQPLRYVVDPEFVWVYSVGVDGLDGGIGRSNDDSAIVRLVK